MHALIVDFNSLKQEIYKWFRFHNKNLQCLDYKYFILTLGQNKQRFIIIHKFKYFKHKKIAIGYYININNQLKCRLFYRSISESEWRICLGWEFYSQIWAKTPINAPKGGYIGEGLLQFHFANYLENLEETLQVSEKDSIHKYLKENLHAISYFYYSKNNKNILPEIQKEYIKERKYISNTLKILNTSIDYKKLDIYKHAQPNLAFSVQNTKNSNSNKAAIIKHDYTLWETILPCLKNKVHYYEFYHHLLASKCSVDIFKLGLNIYIEIAYTQTSKNITFNSASYQKNNVTTRICWVKNVYLLNNTNYKINNAEWGYLTSFGNYTNYADDLWFLIQKPVDYLFQVSNQVYTRTGSENLIANSPYIMLAWYNEKYSKLIEEFKINKHFELFKSKSKKYLIYISLKDRINNFIQSFKTERTNNLLLRGVVEKLLEGCAIYIAQSNIIGYTGKTRCKDFENILFKLKISVICYKNLGEILHNIFVKNTINNKRYSDFLGFGGSIRTTEHSLFTICANHLLTITAFYENFQDIDIFSEEIQFTVIKPIFKTLNQPHDCLLRFYLRALTLNLQKLNRTKVTEQQSKILLSAFSNQY